MKGLYFKTLLLLMISSSLSFAQQNNVVVEQVGSGGNINFTQTGVGNAIGNPAVATIVNGTNNTVSISQIGNTNISVLNIQGDGATINSSMTGDNNNVTTLCGVTGACTGSQITNTIIGDGNTVSQTTEGFTVSTVSINSNNNTVNIQNTSTAVSGAKSSVDITSGGGNLVEIKQAGAAGPAGHDVDLTIVGATNNVDIRQGGAVDSKVISSVTGSGNALTIKSNHQ